MERGRDENNNHLDHQLASMANFFHSSLDFSDFSSVTQRGRRPGPEMPTCFFFRWLVSLTWFFCSRLKQGVGGGEDFVNNYMSRDECMAYLPTYTINQLNVGKYIIIYQSHGSYGYLKILVQEFFQLKVLKGNHFCEFDNWFCFFLLCRDTGRLYIYINYVQI